MSEYRRNGRLFEALLLSTALSVTAACAQRVDPPVTSPPPVARAVPAPTPQLERPQLPARKDVAQDTAKPEPTPRTVWQRPPPPTPPNEPETKQVATAEAEPSRPDQAAEPPAPVETAEATGDTPKTPPETAVEPKLPTLREPEGLSPRYRAYSSEVASSDYTARLGGSNPTPDTAPEVEIDSDARNARLAGDGSFEVAEIGIPNYPDFYGTPARRSDPEPLAEPAPRFDDTAADVSPYERVALPEEELPTATEPEAAPEETPPTYEPYDTAYLAQEEPVDPYEAPVSVAPATPLPANTDPYVQTTQGGGLAPSPLPTAGRGVAGPMTIALLVPESDSRASVRAIADGLAKAAALAAQEIGDTELVLRSYDTAGTPAGAAQAAQKAIGDGAQLLLGPLFSGSAAAVAPVAQGMGVSVISFTTDTSVLGGGVYSLGFLPETEIDRMLSYAAARGLRSLAAIAPNTPYGGTVYGALQQRAPQHGVRLERVQPVDPDFGAMDQASRDFAEFYADTPDLQGVILATSGKTLQALAAYLAYRDVLPSEVKYMGLGIWDDPETFREATLRDGWFPGLDPSLKAEFESRYSGAYGGAPEPIAVLGYDGVAVASALRQSAGGNFPFSRAAIERASGFEGMSGLFRFLGNGRNQRSLAILKVGRRAFELLDPAPKGFESRVTSLGGFGQ